MQCAGNGNGAKTRYTLLSPTLLDLLRAYVRKTKSRDWLFCARVAITLRGGSVQHGLSGAGHLSCHRQTSLRRPINAIRWTLPLFSGRSMVGAL